MAVSFGRFVAFKNNCFMYFFFLYFAVACCCCSCIIRYTIVPFCLFRARVHTLSIRVVIRFPSVRTFAHGKGLLSESVLCLLLLLLLETQMQFVFWQTYKQILRMFAYSLDKKKAAAAAHIRTQKKRTQIKNKEQRMELEMANA